MSTASTIPLLGRAYKLQILNGQQTLTVSNSDWIPNDLCITFDVEQRYGATAWWADIGIFNLNTTTAEQLASSTSATPASTTGTQPIQQGDEVQLSAGYQAGGNFGKIFDGNVFQPRWEKIDVVDYKISLRCVLGLGPLTGKIVATNFTANISQLEVVKRMIANADIKYNGAQISEDLLGSIVYPMGGNIFGPPSKFLKEIAAHNQMLFAALPDGSVVLKSTPDLLAVIAQGAQYTYSPPPPPGFNIPTNAQTQYTILGTPQQTEQGVAFRVLLDPRLKVSWPPIVVKIDNSVVRQLASDGNSSLIAPLATDGTYFVAGVRHVGNTRANEWFTEVTAVTPKGIIAMSGVSNAPSGGG